MTPYLQDADFTLWNCDVLEGLAQLEDESVHCCITSPPYWGLRCYGVDGQYGLEPTPEAYIERMVEVFREVRRVLRKDGTCWLNIGDSYAAGGRGGHGGLADVPRWGEFKPPQGEGNGYLPATPPPGLKPKDLCMIPARLALALQADGWYLRSQIVWAKPNPMPESVSDRPTSAYEFVYLLTRSPRYFYDAEAVREPHITNGRNGGSGSHGRIGEQGWKGGTPLNPACRNLRNVWEIPTEPFPEAHFATYPTELVRRCIAAGTSERGCCPECGAPWVREVEVETVAERVRAAGGEPLVSGRAQAGMRNAVSISTGMPKSPRVTTTGWRRSCACLSPNLFAQVGHMPEWAPIPCTVFDPFLGSGTTALVARKLGRRCVGIELSTEYAALAAKRTSQLSLLGDVPTPLDPPAQPDLDQEFICEDCNIVLPLRDLTAGCPNCGETMSPFDALSATEGTAASS